MTRFSSFSLSVLLFATACSLPDVHASGGWEYEAIYDITDSTNAYTVNLANNADATMVRLGMHAFAFCISHY